MSGVVIAVMARRKKLVRTFKQANAVSIGSSIDTRHFNIRESFLFKKMVAEGIFVSIEDTIRAFNSIMDGEVDEYPEAAFNLVGTLEDAMEKGKKMIEAARG